MIGFLIGTWSHVNIYQPHKKYSDFSWVINGAVRYFVFKVYHLALVLHLFALKSYWNHFLPDGVLWATIVSFISMMVYQGTGLSPLTIIASSRQKLDLTKAGFILSEKCEWEPHQIGVWLGLIIGTISFGLRIPDRKLEKLHIKLDHIIVEDGNF